METDAFRFNRALLEAAFSRYESGARSTIKGSQMLKERGEVEWKYIRGLREWAAKYKQTVRDEDAEFDTCVEIRHLYSDAITEAERTAFHHMNTFINYSNNQRPLEKIQHIESTRELNGGKKIDAKKLTAAFKKAKALKRSFQDCESQWKRVRDRYIKDLKKLSETRVSQEVERQAKKESLDAEILAIQEKIENAERHLSSASKKHNLCKDKQAKVFKEMYADLEILERDRIEATVDAFRNYEEVWSKSQQLDSRWQIVNTLTMLKRDVSKVKAEDILTRWRANTEQRLKSTLTGQTKSLMSILFDAAPSLRRQDKNFGSDIGPRPASPLFRESTSLRYCESLASRRDPLRVRPGKRQQAPAGVIDKEQSLMGAFYMSDSSSESLPTTEPQNVPGVKLVTVSPAKELLESTSVSSLDNPDKMMSVPPTTASEAPPTAPTEFCAPYEESSEETFPALSTAEETFPVLSTAEDTFPGPSADEDTFPVLSTAPARASLLDQLFSSQEPNSDTVLSDDVSCLVNVRVRANRDYISDETKALNFEQGQVIKQKEPKDDKGYCYGWTRKGRFFPKRYGYYPAEYVSFL